MNLKQKRTECIFCNSQMVKSAIAGGTGAIKCPFCGYYKVPGGNKKRTGVRPIGSYKEALEHVHWKIPLLRRLFQKNSVPADKQNEILQILVSGYANRLSEEAGIRKRSRYKKRSPINLDQLKKTVTILLNNKGGSTGIDPEEKAQCLETIDHAIYYWKHSEKWNKSSYDLVKKKSVIKLKNNPKDLKTYTVLIKDLVELLNPLFRDEKKDKYKPRSLKKENTFHLVSELLNCTFPHLQFTPEQIKARFHK